MREAPGHGFEGIFLIISILLFCRLVRRALFAKRNYGHAEVVYDKIHR